MRDVPTTGQRAFSKTRSGSERSRHLSRRATAREALYEKNIGDKRKTERRSEPNAHVHVCFIEARATWARRHIIQKRGRFPPRRALHAITALRSIEMYGRPSASIEVRPRPSAGPMSTNRT